MAQYNTKVSVNIGLNPVMNLAQFNAQMEKLRGSFASAKAVKMPTTSAAKLDTSSAKQMYDTIKQEATALDSVVIKTQKWVDANGKVAQGVVQIQSKMESLTGETLEKTTNVAIAGMDKLDKSTMKLEETTTATVPIKQMIGQVNKEYETQGKQIESVLTKAEKYAASSKNWNKSQQEQMNGLNTTLGKQVQEWLALASAEDKGAEAAKKLEEIKETSKNMDTLGASTKTGAGAFSTLGTHMANAIKQTISYTFSIGALRTAQNLLNEALQFTIELNKSMVEIQVLQAEGAQTDAEINALAKSYNQLAQEMGSTTIEIAKGSVEWLRQGRTIQETTELMKASTMLSKLGALSAAEATEYLTSTINSYKLASTEAVSVVDKLVAVDNASATSTRELATALRYSAATAAETGVSIEQLVSYIGIMSSTTRINAESIGQALKTIFARMQDIKAGKITEEDNLGINNVESALARIDVKLRDSATSFRDFGTVLEDISKKWNTLNDLEQANIAKAIAGVRQQNLFTVLMQNMAQAQELQTIQTNSAGLALDRYGIYLKSVEAAQNRFKAATEALWQGAISSGAITAVIDLGTGILNLIEDFGGLKTIVLAVAGAFVLLNIPSIITGLAGVGTAVKNIGSALQGTMTIMKEGALVSIIGAPEIALIVAATAAVVGLAYVISTLIVTEKEAVKEFDKALQKAKESATAYEKQKDNIQTIKELSEEYKKLAGIANKTTEQVQRMTDIDGQLADLIPLYGKQNLSLEDKKKLVADTIPILERELELKKRIALLDSMEAGKAAGTAYGKQKETLADLQKNYDLWVKYNQEQDDFLAKMADQNISAPEKQNLGELWYSSEAYGKLKSFEQEYGTFYNLQTKIMQQNADISSTEQKTLDGWNAAVEAGVESMRGYYDSLEPEAQGIIASMLTAEEAGDTISLMNDGMENSVETVEKSINAFGDWDESLKSVTDAMGVVSDAIQEQNDNGSVSVDTYLKLIEANSDLSRYLVATGDGYYFASDAAIKDMRATAQNELTKLGLAQAAQYAAQGNYKLALSAMASANMINAENKALVDLLAQLDKLTTVAIPSYGGGGGGKSPHEIAIENETNAYNEEIKAIQGKIKELNKEKDALKDQLDAYKKIIDAKKASLKADKDAADYAKTLKDKNKELSDIENELFAIQFDDSQEAQKRRIELEQEKADKIEEINQIEADHQYDQTVDALDAEEKAYEDMINAQIDAIDRMIDKWNEAIDIIREAIDALKDANTASSGGGGGYSPAPSTVPSTTGAGSGGGGGSPTGGRGGLMAAASEGGVGVVPSGYEDDSFPVRLKSKELFMVFNEQQQNAMGGMRNIISKFSSTPSMKPAMTTANGDTISLNLSVNVQGNLDKIGIGDINREVIKAVNNVLRNKGKKADTFTHSL